MCYLIRCGGALLGASAAVFSAGDVLKQIEDLSAIGAYPTEILKGEDRRVSLFEVRLFSTRKPIKVTPPS